MGRVISLGWKMYDCAELIGDNQPSQNSLARITFVLPILMGLVYFVLLLVGSLPSVV